MHLFKNHLLSKPRGRYLLDSLLLNTNLLPRNVQTLGYPSPPEDLEGVHIMSWARPKPQALSPAWVGASQRRESKASFPVVCCFTVGHSCIGTALRQCRLFDTLMMSKYWVLWSWFTAQVLPTLSGMIPSSLLITSLIYMCSDNIADSFFNEFK